MRIAVVSGGWHYPLHLYRALAAQADADVDLFCIGHRSPDTVAVFEEKAVLDGMELTPLVGLDRELYNDTATTKDLANLGFVYREAPNTVGDWGFLNQWIDEERPISLQNSDWDDYDAILFLHDDTYIRRRDLFPMIRSICEDKPEILLWTNSRYESAGLPLGYARGSFEIFRPELIRMVGGRLPLGDTGLDRTGKTDTPDGMEALSPWNALGEPLRKFMNARGLEVGYLSEYYRVSSHAIEGERGFLHRTGGAPWSYLKGLKELGVI